MQGWLSKGRDRAKTSEIERYEENLCGNGASGESKPNRFGVGATSSIEPVGLDAFP